MLNLTWEVKFFEEDTLIIKLKFKNPQYISTGFSYDYLVIHFKNVKQYFISKAYLIDLSEDYRTLSQKIPRQLSDSPLVENLGTLSESIGPAFKATIATTLVTNLLFAGVLNKFIGAMRPLQIITHLLMFKTIVPANVMIFMENILPITQYDYLEPYWTDFLIKVFKFDVEAQELRKFGGS